MKIFFRLLSKKTGKIFFALLLISVMFCYWSRAQAQTQQDPRIATGVQVSPVRFDWDMNSGDERTGYVNLKNYSNDPYDVDVELEDFYVTNDTTEAIFFVPGKSDPLYAYDVINWIDSPKSVHLEPGEGKDISFQVKVPETTPTGGYYGAIFFKTAVGQTNSDQQNSQIMVHQRVGVLLVMAVKGPEAIRRSASLDSFQSIKKIFWDRPAQFVANVLNSGNLHFKMFGNIDIYKFGQKVDSIPIDERVMYPGKSRQYQQDWSFSPWAYGYYTAKINMVSDDGAIVVNGSVNFWVIPWKTTVSIIILLIIIWLIFKLFSSKFEIKRKDPTNEDENADTN